MRRKKQRCIAAALKAVELLRHEGACVHDVAHSSDGYKIVVAAHIIISFICSQYKQCRLSRTNIEEEMHTAV